MNFDSIEHQTLLFSELRIMIFIMNTYDYKWIFCLEEPK